MPVTVIGSVDTAYPKTYIAPIIEIKRQWSDAWAYSREFELVSCGVSAGSTQVPTCEIKRRYGSAIKLPQSTVFEAFAPRDMKNWWVRVSFVDAQGPQPQFVGQIQDQTRYLDGTAENPVGVQNWVVSGGIKILGKIDISEAFFLNTDDEEKRVGWLPDMNSRDSRGFVVGNRSAEEGPDGVYCYGGDEVWTHRQYIEYILKKFVQQDDGPTWTLAGQTDILDGMRTTARFSNTMKALEILQELISPRYGIDFSVRFTDTGFEVKVAALIADDASVAGATMPRNPNTVTIERSDQFDLVRVQLVESVGRRVDKIRVKGARIVVCGTLFAPGIADNPAAPSLDKKWADELQAEYDVLEDTDDLTADELRARDKYRAVYQLFGAPVDWDLDGGRWAVSTDLNGQLKTTPAHFQNVMRSTLPWLPLKEGFDYSTNPPTNLNVAGHVPEVKAPLAWILDCTPDSGDARYVQCDLNGMSLSVAQQDWGFALNPSINHLLAFNDWTEELEQSSDKLPRYDWNSLIGTIAMESDHRLTLGFDLPENLQAGDGSEMTVVDESAEMWVLLPSTVLDLDEAGQFILSPDATVVLRNDSSRLAMLLAGLYMRYINERVKAHIVIKGLLPWGDLIGDILTTVQQGSDLQNVGAPLTSIEWLPGESPMTIIKTGYA